MIELRACKDYIDYFCAENLAGIMARMMPGIYLRGTSPTIWIAVQ